MPHRRAKLLTCLVPVVAVCAFSGSAFAHEGHPHNYQQLWHSWAFEPGIIIPMVLSAWLYAQGLVRTWRAGAVNRGVRVWQAASFVAGWIALFIALVSPLHPWGRILFSAHMVQHELLMLVAAPLMVLGKPLVVFLRVIPLRWARRLAQLSNDRYWQTAWRAITNPLVAWLIHAVVLWMWHMPSLMNATIENEWIHAAQHLSFFFSALLFWWAVLYGHQRALGYGMAVLYMFTTALHSGLLGILMTFAARSWYPAYAHTTQSWGLSPLEDQQLGGLIMWIPAGVVYIVAGLALLAGWLKESETRVLRREALAGSLAARSTTILLIFLGGSVLCGCERESSEVAATGGNAQHGREKIAFFGCASCHTIPGIRGANALVGPSLDQIASRAYVGGVLINTPENMVTWIQRPRDVKPQTAMPNLHLSDTDARDIAAYLNTLR